jgi:hypothetical protein
MSIDQAQRYDAQAKRDGIYESRRRLMAALTDALSELDFDPKPFYLDTTYLAGPSFNLPATPNPKGGSK